MQISGARCRDGWLCDGWRRRDEAGVWERSRYKDEDSLIETKKKKIIWRGHRETAAESAAAAAAAAAAATAAAAAAVAAATAAAVSAATAAVVAAVAAAAVNDGRGVKSSRLRHSCQMQ